MEGYKNFKIGEAARRMAVSIPTLRKMFDRGEVKGTRIHSNHRRIPDWQVRRYIRQNNLPESFFERPPQKWEILTVKNVSDLMGYSIPVVRNLMDEGHLKGWRLGKDRRFYVHDLANYFRENKLEVAEANLCLWVRKG